MGNFAAELRSRLDAAGGELIAIHQYDRIEFLPRSGKTKLTLRLAADFEQCIRDAERIGIASEPGFWALWRAR
jgi:hypothetical protein